MRSVRLGVAAVLGALGAAAVALPWWRADDVPVLLVDGPSVPLPVGTRAGWELLGLPATALLVVLGVAALATAALGPTRLARATAAASGAAALAAAGAALVGWGVTTAPGAGLAALAGLGALALAVPPPRSAVLGSALAAGLVVVLAATVLPGGGPTRDPVGPYERIADLSAGLPLRPGEAALPASLTVAGTGLAEVAGAPVVYGEDGLVGVDPAGRSRIVALTDGRAALLGVAGGRVARETGGAVLVTGLAAGDDTHLVVDDVVETSRVGDDGSLWLRGDADPPGVLRRLVLDAYDGEQRLTATYLPVVTIREPDGGEPVDLREIRPVPGGALRFAFVDGSYRLERLTATAAGLATEVVAGAPDPGCGLNAGARTTVLGLGGPTAVDATGGTWLGTDGRLARIDADGGLRVVADPLPGELTNLLVLPDGALVLATRGPQALWRIADPDAALTDAPPVPDGCVADPPPVGPPVSLVPVANTGNDGLGIPLGADGRWASGRRGDPEILAVPPDGSVPVLLGRRVDGHLGRVWPDGGGGVWWLEVPDEGTLVLVHAVAGRPEVRYPPVPHPAPREGAFLVTDLGGRPPLLGTGVGVFRIDGGQAVPVAEGLAEGGAVRPDGRGWVLVGGRLLALQGDRVLGPVIDPTGRDDVPVVVQLAKGVPPSRLALPRAMVGLDAAGQGIVVSDGVVLRVDLAGTVAVVAQDRRLRNLSTVEGGLVEHEEDGVLLRVEVP